MMIAENLICINESNSKRVLTLAPGYYNFRGGIGSLMAKYSLYYPNFNFISTYKEQPNKLYLIIDFLIVIFYVIKYLLENKEIKVVHLHAATKGSFYRKYILFIITKYIFSKKIIYHNHASEFKIFYSDSSSLQKTLIKHFVEKCDVLICLSEQWKEYYNSMFNAKEIVILNNLVERKCVSISTNTKSVVNFSFLGVIGDRKGIFDLLDVIRDHRVEYVNKIRLVIGGNGDTLRLATYIKKHDLGDIVKYLGWVTGDDKDRILAETDVYILPSYNEGLPLSILEAMSYGKAIISTPVGGISEIVHESINGYLVLPGDKNALHEKMMLFVQDKNLSQFMGNNSLSIISPFYPDFVIEKLNNIYFNLISNE